MPDPLWQTTTRFRVGMPKAAGADATRQQGTRRHTTTAGKVCGHALTAGNTHPVHGPCGGGVVLRHGSVAHAVNRMAAEHLNVTAKYEQHRPELDKDVVSENTEGYAGRMLPS
eukprot:3258240-Lingulodinium_polyedra.AAC.1